MSSSTHTRRRFARAAALGALVLCSILPRLRAETPPAVLALFRVAVESLAMQDVDQFLSLFDKGMPGYQELSRNIGIRIGSEGLGSTIEVVTDEGNDTKRVMQLDWLLRPEHGAIKRAVITCTLERKGKNWKIVALDPISFFAPE